MKQPLRTYAHKGFAPAFATLKILNRDNYGWVEFIKPQSCDSADAVVRFYQRQGGYLALLYALEATDFHFENLIAAGEHPILIDLESLFHPHSQISMTAADILNRDMVADSVLHVGLLPQISWGNTQVAGVDLSGLGGAKGQLTPDKVPKLLQVGTDTMRVERQQTVIPGSQNRPQLNQGNISGRRRSFECPSSVQRGQYVDYRYHSRLERRGISPQFKS
ncbi:type 2 lanthipeptide synthetase LanM [Nodularia chucula]|uniref:type 2 lanthipeptide synthetase LanM n=1 Tax=Nodularia chucula TaxID=3093667 RepID=UPI0039C642B8